jgi:undecaprenyl-diphosphatase
MKAWSGTAMRVVPSARRTPWLLDKDDPASPREAPHRALSAGESAAMLGPFLLFLKTLSFYAYLLLFAGSCFEVLVPFAIFVPGEVFFYAGGILSAAGFLSIWMTLVACIAGGYLGDIASFYIGKRYAARMEQALGGSRIFCDVFESGKEFMREHRKGAVFLARFLGPAAWVTPFFAGSSGMAFKRFLMLDLIPPLCTIPLHIGIGYGIGLGISFLRGFGGTGGVLIIAPIVVFALGVPVFVVYMHHRHLKKRFRMRHAP